MTELSDARKEILRLEQAKYITEQHLLQKIEDLELQIRFYEKEAPELFYKWLDHLEEIENLKSPIDDLMYDTRCL